MIDWNKPVRTKGGREVRVLCTDHVSPKGYPVVALVKDIYGNERIKFYTIEGKYRKSGSESTNDLENVPEETSYYLNVFKDGSSADHYSMEDAAKGRTSRHTGTKFGGTLHLTFEGHHLVRVEKIDD